MEKRPDAIAPLPAIEAVAGTWRAPAFGTREGTSASLAGRTGRRAVPVAGEGVRTSSAQGTHLVGTPNGYSPTPMASMGWERSARRVGSARARRANSAEPPRIAASWVGGT